MGCKMSLEPVLARGGRSAVRLTIRDLLLDSPLLRTASKKCTQCQSIDSHPDARRKEEPRTLHRTVLHSRMASDSRTVVSAPSPPNRLPNYCGSKYLSQRAQGDHRVHDSIPRQYQGL